MKQKALRAGDAQSHEDEECRKRSARMCRGIVFFYAILHNYDHGKEKMIEERKFNLNLT